MRSCKMIGATSEALLIKLRDKQHARQFIACEGEACGFMGFATRIHTRCDVLMVRCPKVQMIRGRAHLGCQTVRALARRVSK